MRSQLRTFTTRSGHTRTVRLDMPADDKAAAFALFVHCFACGNDVTAAANISRALTSERIGAMHLDFTGLTTSAGDSTAASPSCTVRDLVDAARFLKQEYQPPTLLIGHSISGTALLHAVPQIPSATAVVTLGAPAGFVQLERMIKKTQAEIDQDDETVVTLGECCFSLEREFLDDVAQTQMDDLLPALNAALLICHAPLDAVVGIENARQLYVTAKHPKSFVSLDSADHLLSAEEDSRYAGGVIAAWARRYMGSLLPNQSGPLVPKEAHVVVRTGTEPYRTDIVADRHTLVADEPLAAGGGDSGPTPYDLLLAALGSCTTITLRMYADRKGWPMEEAIVRLSHAKVHAQDCAHCETSDGKIDQIQREIEFVGPLSVEQRRRLLAIADKCPVHRTLHSEIEVLTTEVNAEPTA